MLKMSNLAKLYNMAPSRLHALYGGMADQDRHPIDTEAKDLEDHSFSNNEIVDHDQQFSNSEMSDPSDHSFSNNEIKDFIDDVSANQNGGSNTPVDEPETQNFVAVPDEIIASAVTNEIEASAEQIAETVALPETIVPLFGADSSNQPKSNEVNSINQPDSSNRQVDSENQPELNEVDKLFSKLTGGSKTKNEDEHYIYDIIEPEDLRMWLYDDRQSSIKGGNDEEEYDLSYDKSAVTKYYDEFQAVIDGLI